MDSDYDYDPLDYEPPDFDDYDYETDNAELLRPGLHGTDDVRRASNHVVTVESGTTQSLNAIDCDKTVETWIIKDAKTALAQESAEHKFNFQLNHLRFPGVIWSVSLSLPKEGGDTKTEQMILSHSAKFGGNTNHCWTSVVAELIRNVKMPVAASLEKNQAKPNVEVLGAVLFGPNELTHRESSGVKCEAWPLPLMQSAINDDGTLHIRLTLSLHDIDRAIRSRDLVRGLHQSGILSDFTIKVDQHEFPVHKCVLAAASGEFKALLRDSNPSDSLDLAGVGTASGVKAFLALVYYGEYAWKSDDDPIATIRNVLLLAGQYKMKQIEHQLIPVIQKLVSLDNVLSILTAAVENHASGVAAACYTFLLQNRGAIAKSELLTKLTVNSERDSKVRCAFIEAYFNQKLPCSPTCKCTKPPSIVRRNAADKPTLFPNEDFKLSLSWQFQCPKTDLAKTWELCCRIAEDPSLAQALGCRGLEIWWCLELYPNGRHHATEQRPGYASFVLRLFTFDYDDDGYHVFPRNDFFSRWAYVIEVFVDVGGIKIPVNLGSIPESPIEFTNKKQGLSIDCAWPVSTLIDAVDSRDTITIKAELRLVNVREALSCCVATLSKSAKSEVASISYLPLNQIMGSNTEHFQSVEMWIIKDAANALKSSFSLCSYHGGFGYQHAFKFKQHWAFPELRMEIHPCKTYVIKETLSFRLIAAFDDESASVRYCGAFVIAEIKRPFWQIAEATISTLTFGPTELGDEQADVEVNAWPLEIMRSAINAEDNTLSIRLTLVRFKINEAIQTCRSIRELNTNGRCSDFIVKLGSEQFRAHKCVLATASGEFQKLSCGEEQTSELALPEKTTASGVKAFLALIYFDAYDWQADANVVDTISDVLILSHQYKVERLKKQVADVIVKIVSTSNVVRLLEAAISCEASTVKDVCITFLLENRAKIRNTDCVAQLLRNDRIAGEFLSAFFGQNLCCSRACDCAKAAAVSSKPVTSTMVSRLRASGKKKSIPENIGENELSFAWIVENANASLNQRFLPPKRFYLCPSNRDIRSNAWVATMLPGGRTTIAQHEEFASLSIAFDGFFSDFCGADYFWAYVEANGPNTPGCARVLFEFTPQATVLAIDKFCPVAALRKAIRSADNTLHIHVKITLIGDITAALRCQEMLRVVYEQQAYTDFTLSCKDELVQVHKSVLAQRSEVLAALLSSDMKEAQEGRLDLSDVTTVAGLKAFVDAVYFGELNCTDDEVLLELLKLANLYGLADVKSHCDEQLGRNVDMENALDVLATCELYGLRVAKSACVRFLGNNSLEFLKSSTWQDLNKSEGDVECLKSQVGLQQTLIKELLLRCNFRGGDNDSC